VVDYFYDGTMRSVEQSLTDRLDLLLDVWTYGADAIEVAKRWLVPMLRSTGFAAKAWSRASGLASTRLRCACALPTPDRSMQCCSLGAIRCWSNRHWREFLPLAQQQGIAVLLGGVFNSGILATGAISGAKYNYQDAPPQILAKVAQIQRVCDTRGIDLPTAALHFRLVIRPWQSPQEVERKRGSVCDQSSRRAWTDLKAERLLEKHAPVPSS
jgi:D-threo-aldose 1-dehydrogenase